MSTATEAPPATNGKPAAADRPVTDHDEGEREREAAVKAATPEPKPADPAKPKSKAQLREERIAAAEKEKAERLKAAIERARKQIDDALNEEGLMFDTQPYIEPGPNGALYLRRGPLNLVPDPKVW